VLFGKGMRAILAQLYGRPDRRFYVREIARGARISASSLQRDLKALAGAGIIERQEDGRQVYYQANAKSPVFGELKGIVTKTVGVADFVRDVLRPHEKHIRAAFIYGSIAKGTEAGASDIDLLVVGDLPPSELAVDLNGIMTDLRRAVSLTSYSVEEFVRLRAEHNSFLARVLEGPVIWLIGDPETLDAFRPIQSRKPRARKAAAR
jgi:DNA-binding transcriptional ArsR family regulator